MANWDRLNDCGGIFRQAIGNSVTSITRTFIIKRARSEMNSIKIVMATWCAALLLSACDDQPAQQTDSAAIIVNETLIAEVHEAVDRRKLDKALLARAVSGGFSEALTLYGHIGGGACMHIRPYLKSEDAQTRVSALKGAMHCRDTYAYSEIYALATSDGGSTVRIAALEALGFVSDEKNRAQMAAHTSALMQNADDAPLEAAAAAYGLMQNITYAGVSPADLPELDMAAVINAAKRDDRLGFEAAYLLLRMRGLEAGLKLTDVEEAIKTATDPLRRHALLRIAGQFGDAASPLLRTYALGFADIEGGLSTDMFNALDTMADSAGAINAMAGLKDDASLTGLFSLLNVPNVAVQQLALAALGRRADAEAGVVKRLWDFVGGQNPWLSVTALEALMNFNDPAARYTAEEWLENGSFYKAFRATGMLAGSEEGKKLLSNYLAANPEGVRARLASDALDPASTPERSKRRTVPYAEAKASAGQLLKLSTTRGEIVIEMIEGAPYAAHNFLSLAREGKLDGMVWHRIIPGFVAQAGQRNDISQFKNATIREEWGADLHAPGTVGVATSGPDTGTAQFFINLLPNRHLDGRYTVFGRVISGEYGALQEGDVIDRAEVISQ